jgi:tRNA (mo5U34)-methyltransferase
MDLSPWEAFRPGFERAGFAPWSDMLLARARERFAPEAHGDLARWQGVLARLPALTDGVPELDRPAVGVSRGEALDPLAREALRTLLMELHPWRKGPYDLHGVSIDSEWRSDLKWDRLAEGIAPLAGRRVLDVGCGNGYHGWRMAGAGAGLVLGIDPTLLYIVQFLAVAYFLGDPRVAVFPLALEELPADMTGFDTVFSMGVLYHRRSPLDHLRALGGLLRPGGELVLETLVLEEGAADRVLVPPGRYARMRNVWFIPSPGMLLVWLSRCGFRDARVVNLTATTPEEQRSTAWMRFESLPQCLDPADPSRTVEGHPAPVRGLFIARA